MFLNPDFLLCKSHDVRIDYYKILNVNFTKQYKKSGHTEINFF